MSRAKIILHVKRVLLKQLIAIFNRFVSPLIEKKTGVFLDCQDYTHTLLY